ncbi:MAG TPA: choice-of-anchor Q domain-containing protein [Dokdonella sp.]
MLLLLAVAAHANAGGAVLTWPVSPGCQGTLQACIDAADAGDIVEIATNDPIGDIIQVFGKTLMLRPAAGFEPVFEPTQFTNAINLFGADTPASITVEGMTVRGATIDAYQAGSAAFHVTIRGNRIEAQDLDASRTAIGLRPFGASPTGPVRFEFTGNDIALGFLSGDDISAIGIADLAGATTGTIAGNTVRIGGTMSTYAAISIRNGAGTLDLDVLANRIDAAGYNGGIAITQEDAAGAMAGRVINNLVVGTDYVMGMQPGAISVWVTAGSGEFLVANNTLVGNDTGFFADAAPGGILEGVLANNIVAGSTNRGIVIDALVEPAFGNDHNLVFGNLDDEFTPGPGTLFVDPQFIGAGDYHLQRTTPARDAGNNQHVPPDITGDLDGMPRVMGGTVDIGAYERADSIFTDGFDAAPLDSPP